MIDWNEVLAFAEEDNPAPDRRVEKSGDEWREILSEEAFEVTRRHGTERPFSSDVCQRFEPGTYACVCCATPLFDATRKFDSGTGWPSFDQPITPNAIAYHGDHSLAGAPD